MEHIKSTPFVLPVYVDVCACVRVCVHICLYTLTVPQIACDIKQATVNVAQQQLQLLNRPPGQQGGPREGGYTRLELPTLTPQAPIKCKLLHVVVVGVGVAAVSHVQSRHEKSNF